MEGDCKVREKLVAHATWVGLEGVLLCESPGGRLFRRLLRSVLDSEYAGVRSNLAILDDECVGRRLNLAILDDKCVGRRLNLVVPSMLVLLGDRGQTRMSMGCRLWWRFHCLLESILEAKLLLQREDEFAFYHRVEELV